MSYPKWYTLDVSVQFFKCPECGRVHGCQGEHEEKCPSCKHESTRDYIKYLNRELTKTKNQLPGLKRKLTLRDKKLEAAQSASNGFYEEIKHLRTRISKAWEHLNEAWALADMTDDLTNFKNHISDAMDELKR